MTGTQAASERPVELDAEALPCSFGQARLWFLERLAPGTSAYNVPSAHRLRGPLREDALHRALLALVERHETLRTTFASEAGEPVQRVAEEARVDLATVDLSSLGPEVRDRALPTLLARESRRPFSLEHGPLFRAFLLRAGPQDHVLLLTIHHAVADGWSLGVLRRDLAAAYAACLAGRPPRWLELPIQYADFAHWQRERLEGAVLEDLLAFWREVLGPNPQPLELPTDRPPPAVRTYRAARWKFELPADLSGRVTTLGRGEGATPFTVYLAAFQGLLARWTGRSDPVVGTPVANRDRPELEGLIGLFVNLLPLRVDLVDDPSLLEVLRRARRVLLAGLEQGSLPFERLVREIQPERELSRNPLIQVVFSMEEGLEEPWRLPGLDAVPLDASPGAVKFTLSLSLRRVGDRVTGTLTYDRDLFEHTTMVRLCRQLRAALETMVAAPATALSELPLLSAAERFQLLREWNDTEVPLEPKRVPDLFRKWAAATPEAVALEADGATLTYGELARRAGSVARALRRHGVGPEVPVAVWAGRGSGMVVAILAVLEAGGAYLPLDPEAPGERVAFMVADAGARCVIVHGVDPGGLDFGGAVRLTLEELQTAAGERPEREAPGGEELPDRLAYLIYTSGSTGRPKGVELRHDGLANLVAWHRRVYGVGAHDRGAQVANPAFDAAVWEVWPYLAAGATLCLPPDEHRASPARLASWLAARRVTVAFLPTPLGEALLDLDEGVEELRRTGALRVLLVGGDKLHWPRCADLPCSLVNHYGPSEATVVSTRAVVKAGSRPDDPAPPIGRPVDGARVYALDEHLRPLPVGVKGELFVGGRPVGRGYRGRPGLTAAGFLPDPFAGFLGARMYRTGDLVRWLSGGELEFRGRRDHQVKVRGFRIEPGEIEAALVRHDAVKEAVVAVRESAAGSHLAAFVVLGNDAPPVTEEELKGSLRADLPGYMIPGSVIVLEALPLTPNGKVDREALPWHAAEGPSLMRVLQERTAATPLEEIVAGVWMEALDVERVRRDDDFFALGGHSLLIHRVLSRLTEVLGVELPLRALFEEPTVAGLARRLERARRRADGIPRPPPIEPVPPGREVQASFAQERLWFIDRMEGGGAAYNLPVVFSFSGELSVPALAAGLGEIVRRHEVLRTRFPFSGGRVIQDVQPAPGARLPVIDLSVLPPARRSAACRRLCFEEAHRPFSLERDLPFRARLARLEEAEHVAVLCFHHVAVDGHSLEVFLEELGALYAVFRRGGSSPLPEPALQYRDFTAWQLEWHQGEVLEHELEYWQRRLDGAPPSLELPFDRPRRPVQTFRGASLTLAVPDGPMDALRSLARRSGGTRFMTLLAVFDVLLFRYSGQEDLVVGSPVTNRSRPELEGTIGLFANTLPLRVRVTGEESFVELVDRVREVALSAYAHQELPFERLVKALNPERDPSRNPIFQVAFSVHAGPDEPLRLPGVEGRRLGIPSGVSKFDLLLVVVERGGRSVLELAYSSDLFHATTIRRLAHHFRILLAEAARAPYRSVAELHLLAESERHQIVYEWPAETPGAAGSERVRVLDRRLRPVPVGVVGELCLAGPQGTPEDGRRPGATADLPVPEGDSRVPGGGPLRTGERGRFLPDGRVERLGPAKERREPPPEDRRTRPHLQVDFRPPRTETERLLVDVWREVLGVDRVGIDDNFFDLGGHSLLLVRLERKLSARLGRPVDVVEMFKAPTVASLARALDPGSAAAPARDPGDTAHKDRESRAAGKTRLARQLALSRKPAREARAGDESHRENPDDRR